MNVPADARDVELDVAGATRQTPSAAALTAWAAAAVRAASGADAPVVLTLKVVDAAESRALNARFRGIDRPTNVLSFPAAALPVPPGAARPLGDLAICETLVAAEAGAQSKSLDAHWCHLVVHGVLHLLGHDHVRADEALAMETLESQLVAGFGFEDPYRLQD